ncbi:MAG: condensation domain-containing protein, partial [Lutisporaceae bacterium]
MNKAKLDKLNIQDILGLTPMQEGMLFHYLCNSESKQYLEQLCLTLCGEIDENIIKKAWNHVVHNNEMLRTIFKWDKLDKPLQIVLKQYEIPYVQYELSNMNSADKIMQIMDIKDSELNRKINISENPLRMTIVKLDSSKFELIITYHHILYDGWSNGILLKEFVQACNSLCANKPPSIITKNKFKEFIKHCQKQDKAKQEAFWGKYFNDYEIKSTIAAKASYSKDCVVNSKINYKFNKKISEGIYEFCKKEKTTVAAILYTAWGILLQKYNNTNDIVFGTTVSGRNADITGIEDMVGLLINTLPLRVNNTDGESIQSLLEKVDSILKERDEYQSTPLVDIKSYSGIESKEELFNTLVVIENYPLDQALFSSD